jgi:hypothetical protein
MQRQLSALVNIWENDGTRIIEMLYTVQKQLGLEILEQNVLQSKISFQKRRV